jgi:hypothetical protein
MYTSAAALTDSTTPATSFWAIGLAHFGQVDEHHVAQRVLRVLRDADHGGDVAVTLIHSWSSVYFRLMGFSGENDQGANIREA